MSKKYALIIGNNQYADPNWHDLKTPERDAKAMAAVLNNPKIGGFDRVETLLNASVQQMRIEIANLFDARDHKPDDLLLLYFSGHGTLDSNDKLYFVGQETQHGTLVRATGLEAGYITGWMDSARSRRQVIILDSCYSGSFGKMPKGGVPTQEIFEGNSQAIFERDKTVLTPDDNGYGRHILAATEALQLAWEGDELRGDIENSFFTQFLVEGLAKGLADRNNDGRIDIEELYDHIREGMRQGKQTPIKRSLYASGKLFIAHSPISPFERKQEQLTDLLAQAEQALSRSDYNRAEGLLKTLIKAETDDFLIGTAQDLLDELKRERERARAYSQVRSLHKRGSIRAARTAWKRFIAEYPDYDPDELATQLISSQPPPGGKSRSSPRQAVSRADRKDVGVPDVTPLTPQRGEFEVAPPVGGPGELAKHILPPPFDWIKIPAGQVTVEDKTLKVKPYAIAKYPLTNAQFAPFIEAGGYQEKKWWTEAGWAKCQEEKWTEPRYWQVEKWKGAEQPVVGVSWYEAVAYCRWLSHKTKQKIMLPTEVQWQYAAQGDDGREYPWGNEWDSSCCQNSVDGGLGSAGSTTEVTAYEGKGDSPFGVVDLAGNVWEWCVTQYESGSDELNGTNVRVLRGGSWHSNDADDFRVSYRFRNDPSSGSFNIGFRVALSL